jgi:hemolysin III
MGYLSAALSILVPLALLIRRAQWRGVWLFIGTTLSFASAVVFRMLDRGGAESPLPMGTHFLWHIFGGLSVWMLMVLTMSLSDPE